MITLRSPSKSATETRPFDSGAITNDTYLIQQSVVVLKQILI